MLVFQRDIPSEPMKYHAVCDHDRLSQGDFSDALPHRAYYCLMCRRPCRICLSCDRGQIYCPECAETASRRRIRNADKRYRATEQGRAHRREQCARYRKRRKSSQRIQPIENERTDVQHRNLSEGDRGSLFSTEVITPPLPPTTPADGEDNEKPLRIQSVENGLPEKSTSGKSAICCDFCRKPVSSFQRHLGDGRRLRSARRRLAKARDGPARRRGRVP